MYCLGIYGLNRLNIRGIRLLLFCHGCDGYRTKFEKMSEIENIPKPTDNNIYKIPPTVSKSSPYYSEIPLTDGDLRQRILNFIPPQQTRFKRVLPKLKVGALMVFGTVGTVFVINALLTLEKEKRLESLIAERNRLRAILAQKNNH